MSRSEVAEGDGSRRHSSGAKLSVESGASPSSSSSQRAGPDERCVQGGASSSSSRGGAAPPRVTIPHATNLHHFHQYVKFTPVPEGEFTRVKGWKVKCIFGEISRYRWKEELTVVKDMDTAAVENCRREKADDQEAWKDRIDTPEDALTEIGVYSYLRQQRSHCLYVLKMLGSFRKETTDADGRLKRRTWLVLESCDGDLFDRIQQQREQREGLLGEALLKRYVWQILKGVEFLHAHNIGHRDISLENLLLRNGQVRIMDFGQSVLIRADDGTPYYYFRLCGKEYYRAPEVYVPSNESCPGLQVKAQVPQNWTPGCEVQVAGGGYLCLIRFPDDAVAGGVAVATLCGYPVAPADVFATGVTFFLLHAQGQPWKQALLADQKFRYVYDHGVEALLNHWEKPLSVPAAELLSGMMHVYSAHRRTVRECLAHEWFADVDAAE